MSVSVGLTEPEQMAEFALLSGRMLRELEPRIASAERLKSLRAFTGHGRQDNVLPLAWAQEADAWLERIGVAHETHFYTLAHEMVAHELADFSQWLTQTLPLSH